MSAQTRSDIARLLEAHGLAPIHRLGQHFLADPNITRKIVATAGVGPTSRVIEVGAGTGTLTRALAEAGASVVAYEVDQGLRPVLEEVTGGLDVELRFEDITKVDLAQTLEGEGWVMVANLPYNVGTPLIMEALRRVTAITRFVVMVQEEVAERFVAGTGDEAYGLPSVVVGIYTDAAIAFRVPPQVFYPAPKVTSAVVVLERKPTPAHTGRAVDLARVAFGQRRKMLRRSLSGVLDDPETALEAVDVDPRARAEELSPDDYLRLAEAAP